MISVGVYREMADRFLLWSDFVSDPIVRDLLRKRAQEYLRRADALADSPEPPAISDPAPQQPAFQQQQQEQPSEKSDEQSRRHLPKPLM